SGAVRLARGLAAPDRDTKVVIFSDGGTAPLPQEPVVGASHLVFDDRAPNLSIAGFDAEPSAEGAARVFVQVENHGGDDQAVRVDLEVDGLAAGGADITVPGLDARSEVIPVAAGPGSVLTARLAGNEDALGLDDAAHLVIGGAAERTVAVEGAGSPFLTALIESTPGVTMGEEPGQADVLVVDGGPLPEIDRPAWLMRTETVPEGMELTGVERNLAVTFSRPGDPVLDGVDLSEVAVAEAQTVESLTWLPLVSSGPTPLMLLGEVDGHRVVYSTFDLAHSNLPVQVAFPILGSNLFQWLGGREAGAVSTEPAGAPIGLVTPAGARARVLMPGGETRELPSDAGVFTDTHRPGIYRVEYVEGEGEVTAGEVAVRRFAAGESSGPSREIAVAPAPGAAEEPGFLIREWAPWVIGAALLLMALEWWVAHQRPGLAGRRREATA
ncbi:MAG: hypothetical protein ACLFWM_11225, partial [Actinomycetota bacterium]